MKVKVRNYQNKADLLIQALQSSEAQIVNDYANILLIDFDGPVSPYPELIQSALEQCSKIVLYSHGAPVITAWDGIWKPHPMVKAYLAQSIGQKWVMEAYNYPKPIKVIGWHFCEQKEFIPNISVKNILFAPEHPHTNGYILDQAKKLTRKVYDDLLKLPYQLTVRVVRSMADNGLEEKPDVIVSLADMSIGGSVKAIDEADVVVTYPGTFACLAIARGKPVVMYGQNICPHDGYNDAMLKYVQHWDAYQGYMRYHYDISETNSELTNSIIRRAAMVEEVDWRNKFIGPQMKPEILMDELKGIR